MSISLSDETHKLIKARMKRIGYRNADDLVRDALEFLEASTHITGDDAVAIEKSERQIESGQDLDWKNVSAELRKKYLSE
jgi:Arc/MetJ-type ribon-helix-helix transcriptional regulator